MLCTMVHIHSQKNLFLISPSATAEQKNLSYGRHVQQLNACFTCALCIFLLHRGLKASQATKQVNPTHQLQDFNVWPCIILVFIKIK